MYSKNQKFNFDIVKTSERMNYFISNVIQEYNKNNIRSNDIPSNINYKSCINYDKSCFCINNRQKYYIIITHKQRFISGSRENIMYIFPEKSNHSDYNFYIEPCYIETENQYITNKQDFMMIEGYVYGSKNNYSFLATDILCMNSTQALTIEYQCRYELLQDIITQFDTTTKINGFISIGIHPVFECSNEKNIESLFRKSFVFKHELNSKEYFLDSSHKQIVNDETQKEHVSESKKYIEKTPRTEVYNVYNYDDNKYEGILYIKTIKDSKKIFELFKNEDRILMNCFYNIKFGKYQSIN